MMTLKNIEVERGCNRKLPVSKVIGTVPCTSSNCVNGDLLLLSWWSGANKGLQCEKSKKIYMYMYASC